MRSSHAFAQDLLDLAKDGIPHAALIEILNREIEIHTEKDSYQGCMAQELINSERARQDSKWGVQNHDPQVWMAILGEEYGELCQAANDLRWPKSAPDADPYRHALVEAVQTAAVAKAVVECLLRSEWKWPRPPLTNATEVSHG